MTVSTAQSTFGATGSSLSVTPGAKITGNKRDTIDLSLQGTFAGTVILKRSFNGGVVWGDVETYVVAVTAAVEKKIDVSGENYIYKLECTAYTSGTVTYLLG